MEFITYFSENKQKLLKEKLDFIMKIANDNSKIKNEIKKIDKRINKKKIPVNTNGKSYTYQDRLIDGQHRDKLMQDLAYNFRILNELANQ